MGQKYQHSPYAEEHAKAAVQRNLTILKHALDGRNYLVGDSFTRADLTVASLLNVVNPPPDDLYQVAPPVRAMFTAEETRDPAFAPIFTWRDNIYRKHRGGPVKQ